MAAVRMVEVSVDEVVDVIAMRNRFVAAAGAMPMAGIVSGASMIRRASRRIGGAHFDHVFIDLITVRLMQVAVVQVVHVIAVLDRGVATTGAMDMGVACMDLMFVRHGMTPCLIQGLPGGFRRAGVSLACASALKTISVTCASASA
jgi:hypothetical protein